ncbi:hypothetical protein SU69_08445 [Thermosipho melanesiensis]|uniref:RNA polymerase, sigma-24 subunit, ECF subfamily n=1 Tax=Thermosipho melanesiensis TaxID=46541 RepID=A0ABN4UXS3_9BACT|nr:hypothetical protein BW47_08820 [Thermosipho melanesiensis]OOC35257.1 hypothetical protein SU69_08445 [Thermosipho melanesiensis]OOC35476.1 hypothetical protein SU70_08455 [Thermosipho melanesiensis]OOC36512.1 hypothetical protein SU68_08510 [Thermosipho melanesiensis]OOC40184.1 hypothetical protein SU71_08440 [Thermosipho melanesiensis]
MFIVKKTLRELLKEYLEKNVVNRELFENVKGIVSSVMNTNPGYRDILIGIFGNSSSAINELTNEVFIRLKKKKNILINKTGDNLEGYLYMIVKNYIIDILRKTRVNDSLNDENGSNVEKIEYIRAEEHHFKPEWEIVAETFVEELKKLKAENLCYYLYKVMYSEEILFEEKSRDAKYKIVQRTKESLRELVVENGLNDKELTLAIRIYMSEICEKIRNISRKKN